MEDTESIDYAAIFGVEEDTGPTGEETGAGEEMLEQETAEEEDPSEDEGAEEEVPEDAGVSELHNDDAAITAARRQAEQERDAAVQAVRAESQKALDDFVAAMGIKNPYTGQAIKTKAEYDAYQKLHADKQRDQFMQANGMTEDQYNQFVQSLPEVQQAQQQLQAAKEAEKQLQEQQAKAILDDEIAKISQQDPSIRSVDDLMGAENYDQIYGMVKKGYKLSDAYKLVNFDKLTQKAAAASRQQVRNQALGKSHMSQTQTRGAGAVEVPRDIKQAYLELNPKATDAEIRSHYAKYIKK